jgi:hypothetical protein
MGDLRMLKVRMPKYPSNLAAQQSAAPGQEETYSLRLYGSQKTHGDGGDWVKSAGSNRGIS